jgi:hypothetical protein
MPSPSIYLLVGAGSSVPYGLPSGECLLREFQESLRSDRPESVYDSLSEEQLSHYLSTDQSSIDSLLESAHNSGHAQLVEYGRIFVASRIASAQENALKERGRDLIISWFGRLLDGIAGPNADYDRFMDVVRPLNPGRAGLSINTLNYDTLLELSLINYLRKRFPNRSPEIKEHWTLAPQIYHYHGSISESSEATSTERSGNPNLHFWWEKSREPAHWRITNALIECRDTFAVVGFGFHESISARFRKSEKKTRLIYTNFSQVPDKHVQCLSKRISASHCVPKYGADCAEQLVDELLSAAPVESDLI